MAAGRTIVSEVRAGVLDAELAALLWHLAQAGLPVHVVASDPAAGDGLVGALHGLAATPATVTAGAGDRLEDVLRLPVPLRPASGAVVVVRDGRVAAAHLQRPPLRDAGGHVRPQGPAVLAAWDEGAGAWEHFAWGVLPELAQATGRRAGDLEIELARRREVLQALVGSEMPDDERIATALASFAFGGPAAAQ